MTLEPALLTRAAGVIKCLGHPLRLQLLDALESGGKTVSDLQAISGASQTMVSQQLATLRGHGVVTCRREGTFVRYAISEPKVHHILECIRTCGA